MGSLRAEKEKMMIEKTFKTLSHMFVAILLLPFAFLALPLILCVNFEIGGKSSTAIGVISNITWWILLAIAWYFIIT